MWATSPNRADLASCLRHSAQICPIGQTSDTLETYMIFRPPPKELVLRGFRGKEASSQKST